MVKLVYGKDMIRHEMLYKKDSAFRPVITFPLQDAFAGFVKVVGACMLIIRSLEIKSVLGNRPVPMIRQRQQTLCLSTAYTWAAPLVADRTPA